MNKVREGKLVKQQFFQSLWGFAWNHSIHFAVISILLVHVIAYTVSPQILRSDPLEQHKHADLIFALEMLLLQALLLILVGIINNVYDNHMAEHLGVEATNMLEDLTIYSLKMLIFYGLSYTLTNNAFCNQLIAWLTIYIIISQTYVRNAFWDILQALRSWKVGANSTLNCNHVLSHVVVLTSICNVLAPRLSFVITLSPTIVRIILGLIQKDLLYANAVNQFLLLFAVFVQLTEWSWMSFYLRVLSSLLSLFVIDFIIDYRWKQRMGSDKPQFYLPYYYILLGIFYCIFARVFWIYFPMQISTRIVIEVVRRGIYTLLRIETRENKDNRKIVGKTDSSSKTE